MKTKISIKQLAIVSVAGAILVGVVVFMRKPEVYENTYGFNEKTISAVTEAVIKQAEQDTDGDGLLNWEEDLWGTDKNKADTDGDGVIDGDEVQTKSDPLRQIINDKPEKTEPSLPRAISDTATASLARNVFVEFIKTRQAKALLDTSYSEKIITTFLSQIESEIANSHISLQDLRIIKRSDKASIRKYGNVAGKIILRYPLKFPENEKEIFSKAIETDTLDELNKLKDIADIYKNTAVDFKNMLVPQKIAVLHVSVLNNFFTFAITIDGMSKFVEDPVLALLYFARYRQETLEFVNNLREIHTFFEKRGIRYNSNDFGSSFVNISKK